MPRPGPADFEALLAALSDADIDFIVVGGLACVLHGAGVTTADLDIVPRRAPANAERLQSLLESLDSWIVEPMKRKLKTRTSDFLGRGQLNLSTRHGPLDVLCQLHDGRGFDELLATSELIEDGDLRVRILDLPTLIEVKASTGRAKDRLTVPILLALQEELAKQQA